MPHSPNEPGRPFFPSMRTSSKNKPERPSRPTTQAPRSAVKLGSPDHECAMLPPCRRRGSTYRNRNPKPKSKAPGKGGFVGVVVQLGWGCVGVLQFRPERASGVWLLKSKFSLSALRKSSAARLLQRYRNRISGSQTAPPSPNRGHLAKEGPWVPWGSWGCVGVLRFRPERASGVWLRKSNFRYLH